MVAGLGSSPSDPRPGRTCRCGRVPGQADEAAEVSLDFAGERVRAADAAAPGALGYLAATDPDEADVAGVGVDDDATAPCVGVPGRHLLAVMPDERPGQCPGQPMRLADRAAHDARALTALARHPRLMELDPGHLRPHAGRAHVDDRLVRADPVAVVVVAPVASCFRRL